MFTFVWQYFLILLHLLRFAGLKHVLINVTMIDYLFPKSGFILKTVVLLEYESLQVYIQ